MKLSDFEERAVVEVVGWLESAATTPRIDRIWKNFLERVRATWRELAIDNERLPEHGIIGFWYVHPMEELQAATGLDEMQAELLEEYIDTIPTTDLETQVRSEEDRWIWHQVSVENRPELGKCVVIRQYMKLPATYRNKLVELVYRAGVELLDAMETTPDSDAQDSTRG